MIRKILCPIDFSDHSKAAVASAISLAEARNAEFVLFHVSSFPFHDFLTPYEGELLLGTRYTPRFSVDGLLREAEGKIGSFFATHFGDKVHELRWKAQGSLGKVSSEILARAYEEKVDLIVMGKRRRSALRRFFSQSVSEAVTSKAPCPVLTVCPVIDTDSQTSRGSTIPIWGEPQLSASS